MRFASYFTNGRKFLQLVLVASLVAGCGGDGGGAPPPDTSVGIPKRGIPPTPVPPNASLVVATVLDVSLSTASRASIATSPFGPPPSSSPVKVRVEESRPGQEEEGLAGPGVYTTYSQAPVDSQLVNQRIDATLVLKGRSDGVWWEISNIVPRQ